MKAGFHPLNWRHGAGKHRGDWGCSRPEPAPRQSCVMGCSHGPARARAEPGTRAPSPGMISCSRLQPPPCTAGRPSTRPGPQPRQALFQVSLSSCRGTDRGAAAVTLGEIKAGLQNLSFCPEGQGGEEQAGFSISGGGLGLPVAFPGPSGAGSLEPGSESSRCGPPAPSVPGLPQPASTPSPAPAACR